MAGVGRFKLSDAMREHRAQAELAQPQGAGQGGVPARKGKGTGKVKGRGKGQSALEAGRPSSAGLAAEQLREARESAQAKNAEASTRDRMVEIGRGGQQAGRQRAK
jgi:hypothetical protein